jgi:membrane-associated PAP2 superfamily phosphatase
MNRTGALVALAMAAVTAVIFGLWPQLDLVIAGWFHRPGSGFWLGRNPVLNVIRDYSMDLVALMVVPAVLALMAKVAFPRNRMLMPGRAAVLLVSTIILGPLILTNVILKDHWSRPRPRQVVEFGGQDRFVPWWDPRGTCKGNCSFVAGEASGAAWTLAPAALAPPPWRAVAYGAAIGFTAVIGLMRVVYGGHFFSDVVFGCVFTFLVIWAMHGLLYRWRTRTTDAAIEAVVGRLGSALRAPFTRKRTAEAAKAASGSDAPDGGPRRHDG